MSLRPLTPQSPARVAWEQQVAHELCVQGEMANGDAQGIMEAQAGRVHSLYVLRTVASIAAQRLLAIAEAGAVVAAIGEDAALGADIQLDDPIHTAPGESLVASVAAARVVSPLAWVKAAGSGQFRGHITMIGRSPLVMSAGADTTLEELDILGRRLVAAENACNGIDLDTLETWGAGGVLAATNTLGEANAALGRANARLTAALGESREDRDAAAVTLAATRTVSHQRRDELTLAARTIEQLRMDLQAAKAALGMLVEDVVSTVDYGMPFASPEHGFNESMTAACEVMGYDITQYGSRS